MFKISAIAATSVLALAAAPASAGGFYLQEQSAKEVGRAFSGGAASADDASTVFFNPAGMTALEGTHISLNAHALFVDSAQENLGSTLTYPGGITVPIQGGDGGNPFDQPVVVPSGYVSAQLGDSPIWVGFGVSAPFGLVVEYDEDFFGRYDSIRSDVKTFNLSPTVAVKLSDNFSIGGGIDVQQIDVELINALPNLGPTLPDGRLEVRGDDLSVGWNVGATATFGAIRVGAHYRSKIEHELGGSYEVSGLLGPLAGSNGDTRARAPITLPDIATVSAMYGVGERIRVMATGKWYNWSEFEEIAIYPNFAAPAISPQNYEDTFSGALGIEADVTEKLTLRAGTMYDETPTVDEFRTTRVPDGNRWWASGGVTYDVTDYAALNLSYAHVFVTEEPLDRVDLRYEGTPAQTAALIRSTNTGNADVVAASVALRF